MSAQKARSRRRMIQAIGFIVLVLAFGVVVWIDLTTGLWQQAVILAGIAAGLLTFLLTSLVFERWMARAAHTQWFPVTHLALSDLLHSLGDEEHSEFSRGVVVPRSISSGVDHAATLASIHAERRATTHALARWAGFLAASADVQKLMDHIASLALLLDQARDAVIEAENAPANAPAQAEMDTAITSANEAIAAAVAEIEAILAASHKHHGSQPA